MMMDSITALILARAQDNVTLVFAMENALEDVWERTLERFLAIVPESGDALWQRFESWRAQDGNAMADFSAFINDVIGDHDAKHTGV
jgi:hypothetical protein